MRVMAPGAAAVVAAALFVVPGRSGRAEGPDLEPGRQKAQYCAGCHGADGNSQLTDYPILAGQTSRYLYLQLKDYKSGLRKSDMMTPAAEPLSKEDMLALAAYYAAQRPKGPRVAKGEGSVPFQPDPDSRGRTRCRASRGSIRSTWCGSSRTIAHAPAPTTPGR